MRVLSGSDAGCAQAGAEGRITVCFRMKWSGLPIGRLLALRHTMAPKHVFLAIAVLSAGSNGTLAAECGVSGEVFTVDSIAQVVLVRDDGGYLRLIEVDGRTIFRSGNSQPSTTGNLLGISSGDLLCVS